MNAPANLMDASNELLHRPADEHFASFKALHAAASLDDTNAKSVDVNVADVSATVHDGRVAVQSRTTGKVYPLTNYSAGQLARLAGGQGSFLYGRCSPSVAAAALADSLGRTDGKAKLHLGTVTKANGCHNGPVLRGITSPTYARVADADVLAEVDRWLLPVGYMPALPTKNTDEQQNNIHGNNKPCLFRGDRSMFAFFYTDKREEGAGGRPVRRGSLIRNSEIGASSLVHDTMVFDEFCANFIIWGAKAQQRLRIVHRGKAATLLQRFSLSLREAMPALTAIELETLRRAAEIEFAPSSETAVDRLIKEFELSEIAAHRSILLAGSGENRGTNNGKPFVTVATVANGVTSYAKEHTQADKVVELATIGGDIYLLAAGG